MAPTGVPGANGSSDPGADPSAVTDYINNPTPANFARIDRDRARLDQLINVLLAALRAGNLDVIPTLMSAIAQKSGLTVAQIAATVADQMGRNDTERRAINDRLVRAQGGSTGGSGGSGGAAGRTNPADATRANLELQESNRMYESWTRMLQTTMSSSESINNTTRSIIEGFERLQRAGQQR